MSFASHRDGRYHPAANPHRLYRDPERSKVLGVCAGIADYFGTEPILVRFGAVLGLVFFSAPTLIAYVLLAALLPRRPPRSLQDDEADPFLRTLRRQPRVTLGTVHDRFRDLEQRLGRMEAHVTTREFQLDRAIRELGPRP